jgi:hypothetical protein
MDIKQLKDFLNSLAESLKDEERKLLNARLKSLMSAFPFNEYEYILMFLLDRKVIKFGEYEKLRADYISANPYLELYGLAPRVFGEIWSHQHIIDLDNKFIRANKEVDPTYEGQYDLWLDGTKVEVKSARAINTTKRGNLISKALRYNSDEPFWMNYQQIKLDVADAFIFVGVWVDRIVYWVMSNEDVKNNRYLSHQHRGGIEYQIGVTDKNITGFDDYRVEPSKIREKVIQKRKKK